MLNPREVLRKFWSPSAVLIFGAVIFILGAKFLLIQHYGSDLPFWDQWDAEANQLYIPAAEGRLHVSDFFTPHNEHHIVFTRILAFSLLKLNGQWDARLQTIVNACLHVGTLALLFECLRRQTRPAVFSGVILLALALFGLPFTWENTLAGFQSQFYFLLLFSLLHLAGTFLPQQGKVSFGLAQVAGLLAVFAMASGFFSAAIVVGIVGARACIRRSVTFGGAALAAWNLALVMTGLALKTHVPGHDVLKSADLSAFFASFSLLVAWPSPWAAAFPLTLFPVAVCVARRARQASEDPESQFLLALAGWWLLQVIAIAYARGGDSHGLAPRYFDTLAVGTLIALILWIDALSGLASRSIQRIGYIAAFVLWLGLVGWGIRYQTVETYRMFLNPLKEVNPRRVATVANYVATKSPRFFAARPWLDLPYPNAEHLAQILSNPKVPPLLPSSVRPSLPVAPERGANSGFARNQKTNTGTAPAGRSTWSSLTRDKDTGAQFRSAPIDPPENGFLRFWVTGELSSTEGSLYLETPSHREYIKAPEGSLAAWRAVVVSTPHAPFRIVAESRPGSGFAFTDPVELAFGSWVAYHVLHAGVPLMEGGGLIVLFGASIGFIPPRRKASVGNTS